MDYYVIRPGAAFQDIKIGALVSRGDVDLYVGTSWESVRWMPRRRSKEYTAIAISALIFFLAFFSFPFTRSVLFTQRPRIK